VTEIRRAAEADIPALAALQREGWEHDYAGYAPDGVAALSLEQFGTPAALAEQLRTYDIYNVAVDDGQVTGCICGMVAHDGEPEILWIHVQQAARGSGVGRMLMASFMAELPPDIEHVYVTSFQDYHPTIAFYEHLGFVEDRRYEETVAEELVIRHLRMRLALAQRCA
jgi:ribosomal protein S18 acetylase RimI-like enzyme